MKKVIYLLVLCMVLGMAGCGTNQENKEPVSGNVSVETENKENDDVVQNEQIADTGSYPPCVMVDGVIYKDTGYVASMPCCGTMDGEIVSTVAGTELPSENNQSNFGSGYHYQRSSLRRFDHLCDRHQDERDEGHQVLKYASGSHFRTSHIISLVPAVNTFFPEH